MRTTGTAPVGIRMRARYCAGVDAGRGKPRPYKPKLELEFGEVFVAGLGVGQGFGFVVFYEVVFDAGFAGVGENIFPVDGATSYVCNMTCYGVAYCAFVAAWVGAFFAPVLHVN